ncbi:SDR family NAD(P)-dependent oxidoreductase [Rubritalea tangerina]|uniref:SDR family NAD(P)-dependent oxidoreductase n=1 Tax=Rubritalea tangerina TaxID=430798 RepID=A0ABW4ZEP9_9BACT
MAQAVALVTGANRGIGSETAKQLAAKGHKVLLGVRSEGSAREVADVIVENGGVAEELLIDVSDRGSIEKAVGEVRVGGRLDVLVNNAALLLDIGKQPTEVGDAEMRQTFEVNFFGPFYLTQLLAPMLMASPAGRLVNMSTTVASLNQLADPDSPARDDICPAYQASKAALNVLTLTFAKQFTDSGSAAKSNSCCPGWVMTDMGEEDLPDYGEGVKPKTPAEGADTAVWLATLPADGPTGGFFSGRKPRAW